MLKISKADQHTCNSRRKLSQEYGTHIILQGKFSAKKMRKKHLQRTNDVFQNMNFEQPITTLSSKALELKRKNKVF